MPGDRPVCECHGEPMYKSGRGGWRCAVMSRAYYEANLEREREYQRAYREANRESRIEYSRAWREANREKIAEYESRPDVRLRKMLSNMTAVRIRY